ncbi:hypothetical protein CN899_29035 [Bacillus thuringiensis]|uniref:Clostridial binary toxin B/anthrax toxin PA domain-containing protein n=1 Tax=Bacillus thuringiensis TaxID=1428 RepID=A0A9X7BUN0_BACTU|nr:hypothetical protein CN899_29035 [Bacillus thuringiensis]
MMTLETAQTEGQYGIIDNNGNLVHDVNKKWAPIMTEIKNVSGGLILTDNQVKTTPGNVKANVLERWVATKDPNNPNDKTPEITIGEAIQRAYDAKKKSDGKLYYTNIDGKEVCLDEGSVHLIPDERTKEMVENQLTNLPADKKNVYDATWKKGMNLEIVVPDTVYDFENALNTGWINMLPTLDGYTGLGGAVVDVTKPVASMTKELNLKPFTSYVAKAFVKNPTPPAPKNVKLYIDKERDLLSSASPRTTQFIEGFDTDWHQMLFYFNTGGNPEAYKFLKIGDNTGKRVAFDDVSIMELATPFVGDNLVQNGDFTTQEHWNFQDGGGIVGEVSGVKSAYLDNYNYSYASVKSDLFEVKPGTRYMLELEGQTYNSSQGSATKQDVQIIARSESGEVILNKTITPEIGLDDFSWDEYTFELNNKSANKMSIELISKRENNGPKTSAKIDNVKVLELIDARDPE